MPEIDVPGHAKSWCTGYPDICPRNAFGNCSEPLKPFGMPGREEGALVEEVVGHVLDDVVKMFPDPMLHLGGDEAVGQRVQAMGRERKRRVVVWDEVWDLLGKDAHPQTVVQLWRPWGGSNRTRQARAPPRAPLAAGDMRAGVADQAGLAREQIAKAGHSMIWMQDGPWYLDDVEATWADMASVEESVAGRVHSDMCGNGTVTERRLLTSGWRAGGQVDASDLEQTVWPRLAAIAEALWCLLNQRGVAAAPLTNHRARQGPGAPGGCFHQ
ncbi:glycoside hydrolase superfamily [Baffinella frigidus]|nr:glycoside hydrolase superfamily [Cryptophyta sp. CCMP2293]